MKNHKRAASFLERACAIIEHAVKNEPILERTHKETII